jgi:hypothetical protein
MIVAVVIERGVPVEGLLRVHEAERLDVAADDRRMQRGIGARIFERNACDSVLNEPLPAWEWPESSAAHPKAMARAR